jgi:hypothetical protein
MSNLLDLHSNNECISLAKDRLIDNMNIIINNFNPNLMLSNDIYHLFHSYHHL